MNDQKYYEQLLQGLEAELKHEKQFLTSIKGLVKQCQAQEMPAPDSLARLISEGQARKTSLEQAIQEVQSRLK